MEENKNKSINKNHFAFVFGLFFAIISLILCLNTGIFARILSTPFTFVFGAFSYAIYLFINVLGFKLMIFRKGFKIKINRSFFATLFLIVAIIMYITHFVSQYRYAETGQYLALSDNETLNTVNYYYSYREVIDNIKDGYFQVTSLSLISYPFASGIVGYFLIALFNNLLNVSFGGLIIAIVLTAFSFFLYFYSFIVKIAKERKNKKIEKKNNDTVSDLASPKKVVIKVKNIDVVKGANKIDPNNYESEIVGAPRRSVGISSPSFVQEGSSSNTFSICDNGMFEQAAFVHEEEKMITKGGVVDEGNDLNNTIDNEQFDDFNKEIIEPQKPISEPLPHIEQPIVENREIIKPSPSNNSHSIFTEPVLVQREKQETFNVQESNKTQQWIQPSSSILNVYETSEEDEINRVIAEERKQEINLAFSDFNIGAMVENYTIGPSITRFNIKYESNVQSRSVVSIIPDIQIRLSGVNARFENIIEGLKTSGLEIPNAKVTTVSFKDVYEALPDVKSHPLAIAFGKNINGDVIYADFDEFPHLLIAGATGSGKSIFVNSIIVTLIMRNSPEDLKIVLVDPKKVEMSRYKDMPHLLCPIITGAAEAKNMIMKLCQEMEDRYALFSDNGSTNIKEFNEDAPGLGLAKLPVIIVVLDEYADIVHQCKEISMPVVSLAQKARACGIHILISTQRPSTDVITGVIKANLPTHVALMTANYFDSQTIIGEGGAEKLIGKGDMLVQSPLVSRIGVVRLQGCFIHRTEITRVVNYLKEHYETNYDPKYLDLIEEATVSASEYINSPDFKDDKNEEEKYKSVKQWVMSQEFMSMSRIQRECAVGFNRAGRFFSRLQAEGIVGNEPEGNKGCRVLMQDKFSSSESVVTSDEITSFRSDD